jgi:hypothetical protein
MSNQADTNTPIILAALEHRARARDKIAEYAEILDSLASALNEKRGLWRLKSRNRLSLAQALNHLPSHGDIDAALTELEVANATIAALQARAHSQARRNRRHPRPSQTPPPAVAIRQARQEREAEAPVPPGGDTILS